MTDLSERILPVLELVQTAIEGGTFCSEKVQNRIFDDEFHSMLQDIRTAVESVKQFIHPYIQSNLIRKNALLAMCNCITDGIERFLEIPESEQPYIDFTYANEIFAPLKGLYDALEYAFIIWPDEKRRKEFWKERDDLCLKARTLDVTAEMEKIKQPYDVTLVIMTYNLLDYFKQCFESILKYTPFKERKVQLIVFNHGSTDGTLDYLKQYAHLDFLKIHTCKENIKNELTFMTNHSTWYDTKYTMIIANDTIATKNYLENLLTCITSDDRIAWICPSMCNTSNNQGINVSYNTIKEMHAFAERYNRSDPKKWVELSRLIPVFSMYNNVCMRAVNFADPAYYEFFYGDDDISRAFCRSKFRMIVCKDTYIHHYPSMTTHKGNDVGQRYYEMRKIFFDKFGYDAWNFQLELTYELNRLPLQKSKTNELLFIEPRVGESPQMLKTLARKKGISREMLSIHSVSKIQNYQMDMEGYSDEAHLIKEYDEIEEIYADKQFDAVLIPEKLERIYVNYEIFFAMLSRHIKHGGYLYFYMTNSFSLEQVYQDIAMTSQNDEFDPAYGFPSTSCNLFKILNCLTNNGFQVSPIIRAGEISLSTDKMKQCYEQVLKIQKAIGVPLNQSALKTNGFLILAQKE